MPKILIVEDDDALSEIVSDWLKKENYAVEVVNTGKEAVDRIRLYNYDLLIIDWGLPDISGIEVLTTLRDSGGKAPVLMLTGKNEISEKEEGFEAGADDYLTKPFHPKELSARLRALLRRPIETFYAQLRAGDLELDSKSLCVTKAGAEIRLLPKEFALLEFFMRHPNEVFSQEAILDRVWSSESDASPDTVRFQIAGLRKKIDSEGQASRIVTVHRQGYKLRVD